MKLKRLLLLLTFLPLMAASPTWAASPRVIHVFVALCDNERQGIAPVPALLGNGDDPANNLYWGARYGVKTHFERSSEWKLVAVMQGPSEAALSRVVFRHQSGAAYLVADAYRGREIRQAVSDFLEAASGGIRSELTFSRGSKKITLKVGGSANLLAYVGHDGLMDFSLDRWPLPKDRERRSVIILACTSKPFFTGPIKRSGADPLLWTTGLLAPEGLRAGSGGGWLAQWRERGAGAAPGGLGV